MTCTIARLWHEVVLGHGPGWVEMPKESSRRFGVVIECGGCGKRWLSRAPLGSSAREMTMMWKVTNQVDGLFERGMFRFTADLSAEQLARVLAALSQDDYDWESYQSKMEISHLMRKLGRLAESADGAA